VTSSSITKLVLFVHHKTPTEFTSLEFCEHDLQQPPRVSKHLMNTTDDSLAPYNSYRPINSQFFAVLTYDYEEDYCNEVFDLQHKLYTPLNLVFEIGSYGHRQILVTNRSILFLDMHHRYGNVRCTEWDVFTKQTTSFSLFLPTFTYNNWEFQPLCANERFIVLQECDNFSRWRKLLIFKRVEHASLEPPKGMEYRICANPSCGSFRHISIGCFQPDNAAHVFIVHILQNEDNTPLYLVDVIDVENCIVIIHQCCDKPSFRCGDELCSFYLPP